MDDFMDEGNWRDALAMGINDVRSVAGSRYNGAIREALNYARGLGLLAKRR